MDDQVHPKLILARFPALTHRNYRLFFFGQCISLIGTWMQSIAQAWLVLQLTQSALKLSLVSMVQFLPMMLFALYAGTLADRLPKRRVLIFTQTSLCLLAAILASLTYFKIVQYWQVLFMAFLLGLVNTLDVPARQSFVVELVGKNDLMNAIGLNSSIFNLARILGPSIGGLLIGLVGIAACFYINAISYLAVITCLWLIDTPLKKASGEETGATAHPFEEIRAGIRYIAGKRIIKHLLVLLAFISIFVINFNVLIPVFAQQNLGQSAVGYGVLMTCMGLGSFVGALNIAARSQSGPSLKYLIGGAFGVSLFTLLLGLERSYHLACITLVLMGFCVTVFTALVNSTIQLNSADNMRGRVMSVYSLVFLGVTPIGSLYAGNITERAGAPFCMIVSGVIGIAATSYSMMVLKKNRGKGKAESETA
ncbi:MAG: MFS transporter [Syntrophomonas sp.]